ncbi:MAG: hypothetical protein ACPGVB_05215 [Chitinophagales bacterium]
MNKLNNSNCFDFDYQPKENDFLIITEKLIEAKNYTHSYPYICFSYSENKWKINYFSDIDIEVEELKGGEIKVIAHNKA